MFFGNMFCRPLGQIYFQILTWGSETQLTLSLPDEWQLNESEDLADPLFRRPSAPEMLVGVEVFSEILQKGLKKGPGSPSTIQTSLGWVVIGSSQKVKINCMMTDMKLKTTVQEFWGQALQPETKQDPENELIESHFKKHTRIDKDDYYVVRIPFRQADKGDIGINADIAYSRFMKLENDMQRNPKMAGEYKKVMQEEFENGFLREIKPAEVKAVIPHHGVFRES